MAKVEMEMGATFFFTNFSRYGVRAPTEECGAAVVVISLQSIVGVVIQVRQVKISSLQAQNEAVY